MEILANHGKSRKITETHENGRKQFGQITETVGVNYGKSRKRPSGSLKPQSNQAATEPMIYNV